jgi:hypothetical protein
MQGPARVAVAVEPRMFRDVLVRALCPASCVQPHVLDVDLDDTAEVFDYVVASSPVPVLPGDAQIIEVPVATGVFAGDDWYGDDTGAGRRVRNLTELVELIHRPAREPIPA